MGTATVASPTEPFRDAIDEGVNGLLASTTDEWIDAMNRLLTDELLRERIGHRARRDALVRWSPQRQGERYLALLERSVARLQEGPSARSAPWSPVVIDEAVREHAIDPYFDDGPRSVQRWWHRVRATNRAARSRLRGFVHRLRVSVERDGMAGTASKVPGVFARLRARVQARVRRR